MHDAVDDPFSNPTAQQYEFTRWYSKTPDLSTIHYTISIPNGSSPHPTTPTKPLLLKQSLHADRIYPPWKKMRPRRKPFGFLSLSGELEPFPALDLNTTESSTLT